MSMLLVYFNVYYLIPKFILKKKYKLYILFFFITLSVWYVIRTELIYYLINENVWPESETPQMAYSFNHIIAVFLIGLYEVAFVTAIKLMADWIYVRRRVENLQEIQLRTELDFLKTQIQPHFFFNTLNNLYALTLEKSDVAPSVVLKLSDIMQYVLYDASERKIRLFDEIKYIQNYIDLERLRYGDNVDAEMEIEGDIGEVEIPSLLFIPFIENCFKHGIRQDETFKLNVKFEVVNNKWLFFEASNPFNPKLEKRTNHGIGIKNVLRRLELLYQTNYTFETKTVDDNYIVTLKIPIT